MIKIKSIEIDGDNVGMFRHEDKFLIIRNFDKEQRQLIMFPTKNIVQVSEVWDTIVKVYKNAETV